MFTSAKTFLKNQKGAISIITAILAPVIGGLLTLSFDGANMLSNSSKLNDALREASLGASTLKDDSSRKQYVVSYLKAYFNDKNLKISDVEITKKTSHKKDKDGNKLIPDSFTYNATLKTPFWFSFNKSEEESENLAIMSSESNVTEPTSAARSADYLFALDFSNSMNMGKINLDSDTEICNVKSAEYDREICTKLKNATNRAEAMQAAIISIIKLINTIPNDTSLFSFLPYYAGSQTREPFNYTIAGMQRKSDAVNFVLQVSFKPEYRITDYDCWSRILASTEQAVIQKDLIFSDIDKNRKPKGCSKKDEKSKALRFFNAFTSAYGSMMINVKQNLINVIDYEATLENMFYPERAFKFRFLHPADLNSLVEFPNKRPNGVAYDFYCTTSYCQNRTGDADVYRNIIRTKSTQRLTMKFYEEDFKPIKNPFEVPILNEAPFLPTVGGGNLTIVSFAILRGAAMLSKGKHKRRVLIVITDGYDGEALQRGDDDYKLMQIEKKLYDMNICKRVTQGYRHKGIDAEVFFINISKKSESSRTLERFKKCAGENNAFIVENMDEFLKAMKKAISGGKLGEFLNKDM